MSLRTYRKKRDFTATREPRGDASHAGGASFVVQKHAASHLHYDFRLEHGGVLWSWAVPKGPSLDPSTRRLAVQVEDHPVEYGDFEGTIPEGEYGGGTVMVWDRGTWRPDGDAAAAYRKGHIAFTLQGDRLRGHFHLVRTGPRHDPKPRWLLMKVEDEEARPDAKKDVIDRFTKSVKTGRSMEAIAKGTDVWHPNQPSRRGAKTARTIATKSRSSAAARHATRGAKAEALGVRGALPPFIAPQLATLVDAPPQGVEWLHEVKLDGYRLIARCAPTKVTLLTRNEHDWTAKFPTLARALRGVASRGALLDGEVVARDGDGRSDFQTLQNLLHDENDAALVYYVFDLLHLDGRDLRDLSLMARKAMLRELVTELDSQLVLLSDHVEGGGDEILAAACKQHLEGVVSKRRDAPYSSGRGADWLKSKCIGRQEFVIGGYSPARGSRTHFGALLMGERVGRELRYAGKVGTGFSHDVLASLHESLEALTVDTPPFVDPPHGFEARGVTWVRPKLVCEISFTERTRGGHIRHPVFQGLRADKPARDVVREVPKEVAVVETPTKATKQEVHLSHPDKVLYSDCGVTKAELAAYYEAVAEEMMPHVKGRPLTLVRFPRGHASKGFFWKHANGALPPGVKAVTLPDSEGEAAYMTLEEARGLPALVQLDVLEMHTWGAHVDDVEHPDLLVLDLDPDPSVGWARVVAAAKEVRDALSTLGLTSFVKTTGGKGLHVCVPIARRLSWDVAKEFTERVADAIVASDPKHYVATMSKAARQGKVFLDYLRNGRGATFVAPYSSRARDGATVAMPVAWEELTAKLNPREFTVKTVPSILAKRRSDPWAGMLAMRQRIPMKVLRGTN